MLKKFDRCDKIKKNEIIMEVVVYSDIPINVLIGSEQLQRGIIRGNINAQIMFPNNTEFPKKTMSEIKFENHVVDLLQATDYLIKLYESTREKYRCTTTKLGKLLSIAAFICAKSKIRLFNDDIITQNCGTTLSRISNKYDYTIIDSPLEATEPIDKNEIIYNVDSVLSTRIKDLLLDIFLRFGKYPARDMGQNIDSFKAQILQGNTVDIHMTCEYFNTGSNVGNELEQFIRNYKFKSEN